MKKFQVVFTKTNAILLEDNLRLIKPGYLVLTNPKFQVDDEATQYWKMGRNNSVITMNHNERLQRDKDIENFGMSNDLDIFQPIIETGSPVDYRNLVNNPTKSNDPLTRSGIEPKDIIVHLNLSIFNALLLILILVYLLIKR